jgi:hypothetical protein
VIANRSVPDASIIPVLAYADVAEATEWHPASWGGTLAVE